MTGRIITILLFLFYTQVGFTQKTNFTATVDRQQILIGEPFILSLEATVPNAGFWPSIDTLPHFEIMESKIDSQQNGNRLQIRHTLTLTSWDSGKWNIPSFAIRGLNRTQPIAITVSFSTPFDPNQEYHDVKDIMEVEKPARITWYWYLIGLLLLLILFVLLFPTKKKKPNDGTFVPDEGIYRESLKRLDKLKQQPPAESKQFYTELIVIFRDYLHKRKGIQSHAQTTDDLSHQLKKLKLDGQIHRPLVQTLQLSDLVKFARFDPIKADNEKALETIRQSIIAIEKGE
ncbi:MAG TPA: BatD family protein [Flavisolibacter sp.]|nr:BatD family protein [Flavisolibacter sp.]